MGRSKTWKKSFRTSTELSDGEIRLRELRKLVYTEYGQRKRLRKNLREAKEKLLYHSDNKKDCLEAMELLQAVVDVRREQIKEQIESLVTRGLKAVFGMEDIEFKINISITAAGVRAKPVLVTVFEGKPIEVDIIDGHGGGVADIVSFLLRTITLILSDVPMRRMMVLDESFRHVSPQYLRGVCELIKELSASAGIQFVIVTHKQELLDCADVVYESSLDDERGTVYKMRHDLRDERYHSKKGMNESEVDARTLFDHERLIKAEEGKSVLPDVDDPMAASIRKRMKEKRLGNHIPGVKQMKGIKGHRFHTIKKKKKKRKPR